MTPESSELNQVPWEPAIAGFNALVEIGNRIMKSTMLMNGAAAVAIMAYLGKGQYQPAHGYSLILFASGVLCSPLAYIGAYMSQLEHNEVLPLHSGIEAAVARFNDDYAKAKSSLETMSVGERQKLLKELPERREALVARQEEG